MNKNKAFEKAMKDRPVPLLVLDQRWHKLFAVSGKPEHIAELEKQLNAMLLRQGQLNDEIKEYKYIKGKLLHNIVHNMDGASERNENTLQSKILDKDKELIEELNEKLGFHVEEKKELPYQLEALNQELMLATMEYCNDVMHQNTTEIAEISQWISSFRLELKKNVIRKKACESNNKAMYRYLYEMFGMDMLQLFGVNYKDFEDLMGMDKEE